MPMLETDEIIGKSRGTAAAAKSFAQDGNAARLSDCSEYITAVNELCEADNMPDSAIVIAQSLQETTYQNKPWNSAWWRNRLNPAGMGITGDPTENAKSPTFKNGTESARAQVAHLLLYTTGKIDRGGLMPRDDPRYDAYIDAYGNRPMATTILDLAGKWAVDEEYAEGICRNGNACFKNLPNQSSTSGSIVFGRVPHPKMQVRDIGTPPNTAWDNLGKRTIKGIVWHRMLGSLVGTDGYFRGEGASRALTDYGVGVSAQDGANLAGVLYRWNDPKGNRSPWANGSVNQPYGDGQKFIQLYGVNAVNRDLTSLEISGFQTTPLDSRARQMIVMLSSYWADQYHVPWNLFPHIPKENNRSFVIWHQEFTIGTGKKCPFDVVMAETESLLADIQNYLKTFQGAEAPEKPTYPERRIPVVIKWQGFTLTDNCPNRFNCVKSTTLHTYPNEAAPAGVDTPTEVNKGYTFDFETKVDGKLWLVSKSGSCALASAFEEK